MVTSALSSPTGDPLTEEEADELVRSTKRARKVRIRKDPSRGIMTEIDAVSRDQFTDGGKRKMTFRDSVLGSQVRDVMVDDPNSEIAESDASDSEDEALEMDDVKFTREQLKRFRAPWRSSLILKVLGRRVGYHYLKRRLLSMWRPKGGFKLISIGFDYFLARFEMKEDREVVLNEGPWKILDHYLAVRRWVPNFRPSQATIDKATLWVRVPDFPMEFSSEEGLQGVGNFLGKTIKVDVNTMANEMGNFARLCVEVDLTKSLKPDFTVLGRRYGVTYEGIHLLCFHCGMYGHKRDSCPQCKEGSRPEEVHVERSEEENSGKKQAETEAAKRPVPPLQDREPPQIVFGPWTIVSNRRRKVGSRQGGKSGQTSDRFDRGGGFDGANSRRGSRFQWLAEDSEAVLESEDRNLVIDGSKQTDGGDQDDNVRVGPVNKGKGRRPNVWVGPGPDGENAKFNDSIENNEGRMGLASREAHESQRRSFEQTVSVESEIL